MRQNHPRHILRELNQLQRLWHREQKTSDVARSRDWLHGVVYGLDEALRLVRGYRKSLKRHGIPETPS